MSKYGVFELRGDVKILKLFRYEHDNFFKENVVLIIFVNERLLLKWKLS